MMVQSDLVMCLCSPSKMCLDPRLKAPNERTQVKAWRRALHLWDQGDAASARQASKRIAGTGSKLQSDEEEVKGMCCKAAC